MFYRLHLVRDMRIHVLVCLDGVPAHPRTRAPVLSAPAHITPHAVFGAAYRRRSGTGVPAPLADSGPFPVSVGRAGR